MTITSHNSYGAMFSTAMPRSILLLTGLVVLGWAEPMFAQIRVEPVDTPHVEEATGTREAGKHLNRRGLSSTPAAPIDRSLLAASPHSWRFSGEHLQETSARPLDRRWRNTLIGASIGAGITRVAGLGVVCSLYCSGNSNDGMGIEIIATPFFTGVGALVGGIIGYLRPVPPNQSDLEIRR